LPLLSFSLPILQLHPTRRCNLRCLHCYSSSAPTERFEQDASQLEAAIADAASQGYRVVSISGGEPLLYFGLPSLLAEARRHGLRTTITTNGLLLDDRRLRQLSSDTDFLAISLDGVPERHNYMRNSPHAFKTMRNRLAALRESGLPFGFLFTLTHQNICDLEWVVEFAAREGATLVQVHPLEETGRAQSELAGHAPTDVDAALAWLRVQRLQKQYSDRLRIHLDLFDRDALRNSIPSAADTSATTGDDHAVRRLAEFISPLVVESDGTVVPLQYGFPRTFALGNLNETPLSEMARSWFGQRQSALEFLYERARQMLCQPAELPFVNWYEFVVQLATQPIRELVNIQ
jgi:MoaA/NifB/PqqE/SkfB family radical SAM enzyme